MNNYSNRLTKAEAIAINCSTVTTLCRATIGCSKPYTFLCGHDHFDLKEGDLVAVKLSNGTMRVAEVITHPSTEMVLERDFWPGLVVANLSDLEKNSDDVVEFLKQFSCKINKELVNNEKEEISKLLGVDISQLSVDTAKEVFK